MKNHDVIKEQISVIVLNYNGVSFLNKCFTSIFKQDYPNVEIILVDNASTDNSVAYVSKHFPKVKIIRNKVGLGFAGGNMVGVKAATSQKVLLVSNDTWLPKDLITKLSAYFNAHDLKVVAPHQGSYDGKKNIPAATLLDPLGHHAYLPGNTQKPFYLTGVCLFCEKDFYLETKGMDPDFFLYIEDADWFWRIQLFGYSFDYVPDAFIFHSGAGSSGGHNNKILKTPIFMMRNRNTLYMFLKNYSLILLIVVLPIYILINLCEILFFLVLGKFSIVKAYFQSWIEVMRNWNTTMEKRKWIQKRRVVSDITILQRMYKKPAKLIHLLQFYT